MKTFLLIVVFLFNLTSAQQMSEMEVVGKGEFLPNEMIAKNNRDANGMICAGLMVVSDLDGLSYKSYNGIIKIDSNPGKDLLFISGDERVVEIYKTGFTPLKIILNELGIKLNSGEVWQIKITGNKTDDIVPVNIITDPVDSEIYIDGEFKGTQTTQQITEGIHEFRIQKSGFKTILDSSTVSVLNNLFNYHLEKIQLVAVTIKSIPHKAKIFLNNTEKGETDDQFFEFPGRYNLKLILKDYEELHKEIEISETGINEFSFSLMKDTSELKTAIQLSEMNNISALNLIVQPSDAKVLINKRDYGNKSQIELLPGRYQIELLKEGYYPIDDLIEIEINKTLEKTYSLDQMKGNLQCKVRPIEAQVELKKNNKTISSWNGARLLYDLPTGEYVVSISLTGYEPINKLVVISENNTTVEDFNLDFGNIFTQNEISEENQNQQKEIDVKFSRTGALMQSILLPGLGQITNGRKFGWIYTAAAIGGGVFYMLSSSEHNDNVSTYNDLNNRYRTDITVINKAATENAYSEVKKSYDNVNIAVGILAAIYISNLVDAIIFNPDNNETTFSSNFQPEVINHNGQLSFGINLRVGL